MPGNDTERRGRRFVSSYCTKLLMEPGPWVSKASCLSSSPLLAHGQVTDNWFIAQTQGKADTTELLSAYRLPTLFLLLFLPWKLGKLNKL